MHLAFITRGHKTWVDKFINELSTRYFEFDRYNYDTKKMERVLMDARLCPIQLWDFVFPSEYYDSVAATILSGYGEGKPEFKSHQKFVWALRKAMKFRKIPPFKKESRLPMLPPQHMEVIGIGVKDDYWIDENKNHIKKEDKTPLSWEGI